MIIKGRVQAETRVVWVSQDWKQDDQDRVRTESKLIYVTLDHKTSHKGQVF